MAEFGDLWGPPTAPAPQDPAATFDDHPWGGESTPAHDGQPARITVHPAKTSVIDAAAHGIASGVTAGFNDEIQGVNEASGLPKWLGNFRGPIGAARLAYEHITGQPGEAHKAYEEAVNFIREQQKTAQEEHPVAYGLGNVGGSIAGMVAAPEIGLVKGAVNAGRLAQFGARAGEGVILGSGYGAAQGAGDGTDATSRATGAASGAASGAVGGAIAAPLGAAAEGAAKLGYNYTVKPLVSVARGLVNPEGEASRRVVGAISRDVQSGNGGLTPSEWLAAHNDGAVVADLGGPTTKNLLRSAANTSPEGEGTIKNVLEPRYKTQSTRFADTVRGLVASGANATKSRAELEAAYDIARKPAYAKAYAEGDKPIWSTELERLTSAPAVAGAVRGAVNRWKDFQVKDGYGGMNPPIKVTPDGQLKFTGGKGMNPYPNIQLWDYASRVLAGAAAEAKRAGNATDAGLYGGLEKQLKNELDKLVPSFKAARGSAAEFFGGNNAIEAGEKAVAFRGDPIQVRIQMNKMGDAERDLFKEGFATKLAEQIEATGDRTNIVNKVYNSPQSRQMIRTVFGDEGATKMEMRLRLENIFQSAKDALGNSTTAKQLIQAGLAGGALGAYLEGHDLTSALTGGAEGVSIGAGVRAGGSKLVGLIDQRTAQKVAELLSSNDLSQLTKGINIATRNERVGNAIRALDNRLAALGGAKAVPALQAPTVGRADSEPDVPRPPGQ